MGVLPPAAHAELQEAVRQEGSSSCVHTSALHLINPSLEERNSMKCWQLAPAERRQSLAKHPRRARGRQRARLFVKSLFTNRQLKYFPTSTGHRRTAWGCTGDIPLCWAEHKAQLPAGLCKPRGRIQPPPAPWGAAGGTASPRALAAGNKWLQLAAQQDGSTAPCFMCSHRHLH